MCALCKALAEARITAPQRVAGSILNATNSLLNKMARRRNCVLAGALALLLCVAGWAGTPAESPKLPVFQHVFVVVEENQTYDQVIGNTKDMPYLNSLAEKYGLATNYFANTHPSINNYFYLTAGRKGTKPPFVSESADLYPFDVDGPNVASILSSHGKTWKSYAEDLPRQGYIGGNAGDYVKRHNPFAYFETVRKNGAQRANIVPFKQLKTDVERNALPDYGFIVPNIYDDAHNDPLTHRGAPCGDAEALQRADNWLRENIGPLIDSTVFQQGGLLVITFDEACASGPGADSRLDLKRPGSEGGGHVATILVSPKIAPGTKSDRLYHHQSVARLSLEALGVDVFPRHAATAPDMRELFAKAAK
jgi:phosphatidylinositol-3-phosphatase